MQSILKCFSRCYTAITCDSPGNGTNTVPIPPNIADGMTYLESYTYSCMEGYSTNDPLCVVCQPDSTLSISPPVCTGDYNIVYSEQSGV